MISIKIEGVDDFLTRLALAPRQIEIATQRAMLKTAQHIHKAEKDEMQRIFDRPTRWTLGAMRVKVVNLMEIKVGIVDPEGAYKRTQSYLGTQVTGGDRKLKAVERALQYARVMPSGWQLVPGQGARLDQYGNVSSGQYKQIMSWFDAANRSAGSEQNMGHTGREKRKKMKGRFRTGFDYFFVLPGKRRTKLLPGIYQRFFIGYSKDAIKASQSTGDGKITEKSVQAISVKPILIFVQKTRYKPLYDFDRVARQTFDRVWPVEAEAAVQREIKKIL